MAKEKWFKDEAELISYYQKNPGEIDGFDDNVKQKQGKRSHKSRASQERKIVGFNEPISNKADIIKLAKELRSMIYAEFEKHPAMKSKWIRGQMFSTKLNWTFDKSNTLINDVTLQFNESDGRMYKRSMNDTHWSFMPVLWEYGWSWDTRKNRGHKLASNNPRDQRYAANRRIMTYQYFEGTHAIQTAISKFNTKYASDGIYARFMLGDTNIDLIPKNRNIPYMRADIESLLETGDW